MFTGTDIPRLASCSPTSGDGFVFSGGLVLWVQKLTWKFVPLKVPLAHYVQAFMWGRLNFGYSFASMGGGGFSGGFLPVFLFGVSAPACVDIIKRESFIVLHWQVAPSTGVCKYFVKSLSGKSGLQIPPTSRFETPPTRTLRKVLIFDTIDGKMSMVGQSYSVVLCLNLPI